jgi:hypothetical protein
MMTDPDMDGHIYIKPEDSDSDSDYYNIDD